MQTKDSASEAMFGSVGGIEKSDAVPDDGHFEEHLSSDRNDPNARKFAKCTNETTKKDGKKKKKERKADHRGFPGDACSSRSAVKNDDVHNAAIDVISSSCSPTPAKPLPKARKKLLVLDLNGLLADIRFVSHCTHQKQVFKVNRKSVFKRPFCDEFLSFCFKAFEVGVWSSRRAHFVNSIVDYIMGDKKHKLLFCWDVSKCTATGFMTIENRHKPLVLKELRKLWDKEAQDLPWSSGEFSPLNTLLLDDSPYKALCNPETAEVRLEQIKSSVTLPFHSFSGLNLEMKLDDNRQNVPEKIDSQTCHVDVSNPCYELKDIISLDDEAHAEPTQIDNVEDMADGSTAVETDIKDEQPLSLAEMSLSSQKCLESKDTSTSADSCEKSWNSNSSVKFEPFNYDAVIKQKKFIGDTAGGTGGESNTTVGIFLGSQKSSVKAVKGIEQGSNFQQPRRRQAFPPSGNRSATFR